MGKPVKSKDIICEIEALHDFPTGNFINYTVDSFNSAIYSWTKPYAKPVILFHKDEDGVIVGRVLAAEVRKSVFNNQWDTLVLTVKISDEDAKQGVMDGRYLTTSVGVTATEVYCSVCGKRIGKGSPCKHVPGKKYGDNYCYYIVKQMKAKEVSFVIIPADSYSQVISYWYEGDKDNKINLYEGKDGNKMTEEEIKLKEAELKAKEEELSLKESELTNKETEISLKEQEIVAGSELVIQLKEELETSNTKVEELLKQNKTAELEEANLKLTEAQNKLAEEERLRLAAEAALQRIEADKKDVYTSQIISLREKLNMRKIDKEELDKRSVEYLKESLSDLEQEFSFKESYAPPKPITNDKIVIDKPNTSVVSPKKIMDSILK